MVTAADAPAAAEPSAGPEAAAPKKSGFFPPDSPFIVGSYTLGEVRDYTGTPVALSRRFVQSCKGREGLWGGKREKAEGRLWVTFRDLMELRFINALHQAGWPWGDIRKLGAAARQELGLDYPLASPRFQEAGPALFQRLAVRPAAGGQNGAAADGGTPAFPEIIPPLMYESADYDGDLPLRWYPGVEWGIPEIGRWVNLDPGYTCGQPTLPGSRMFSWILANDFYLEERNAALVARTYRLRRGPITEEMVMACVAFEEELRRRNSRPSVREEIIQARRRMREPYEFLLR